MIFNPFEFLEMPVTVPKAQAVATGSNPATNPTYLGGKIFFVDDTGIHGSIVASADLGPVKWHGTGTNLTIINKFLGIHGLDSFLATNIILGAGFTPPYAAQICRDYGNPEDNWSLPSLDDLLKMCGRKVELGFQMPYRQYWSSSEDTDAYQTDYNKRARYVDFSSNAINISVLKSATYYVRAIRKF